MSERKERNTTGLRVWTGCHNAAERVVRRPELTCNSASVKSEAWIVLPAAIPVFPEFMPPIRTTIHAEKYEGRYRVFYIVEVADKESGSTRRIVVREDEAFEVDAPEVGA